MDGAVATLVAISVEQAKKGLPIVIQDPGEMAMAAGVMLVMAIPIYLATRRRSLRRTLRG